MDNNRITLSLLDTTIKESLKYGFDINNLDAEIYKDYIEGFASLIKINDNLNIYKDKTFNRAGSYNINLSINNPSITIQDCIRALFNNDGKLGLDILEAVIPYIPIDTEELKLFRDKIIINFINLAIKATDNAYKLILKYKEEITNSRSELLEKAQTFSVGTKEYVELINIIDMIEKRYKGLAKYAQLIQATFVADNQFLQNRGRLHPERVSIKRMLDIYNMISWELLNSMNKSFRIIFYFNSIKEMQDIANKIKNTDDLTKKLELRQKALKLKDKINSTSETSSYILFPIQERDKLTIQKADHFTLIASIAYSAQDNGFVDDKESTKLNDIVLSVNECEAIYNLYLIPLGLSNNYISIWLHIARFKENISIDEYYNFIKNIEGYDDRITKDNIEKLIIEYRKYVQLKNPDNIRSLRWLEELYISTNIQDNKISTIEAWDIIDTLIKPRDSLYSNIDFRADVERFNILAKNDNLTYEHNNNYFVSLEVFRDIINNRFNNMYKEELTIDNINDLINAARYYRLTGEEVELFNMDFPAKAITYKDTISLLFDIRGDNFEPLENYHTGDLYDIAQQSIDIKKGAFSEDNIVLVSNINKKLKTENIEISSEDINTSRRFILGKNIVGSSSNIENENYNTNVTNNNNRGNSQDNKLSK